MAVHITDVNKSGCTLVVKNRAIKLSYEEVTDVQQALHAILTAAASCGWVDKAPTVGRQTSASGNRYGSRGFLYPDDTEFPVEDFPTWKSSDPTAMRRRIRELDEETLRKCLEFEEAHAGRLQVMRPLRMEIETRERMRPRRPST